MLMIPYKTEVINDYSGITCIRQPSSVLPYDNKFLKYHKMVHHFPCLVSTETVLITGT